MGTKQSYLHFYTTSILSPFFKAIAPLLFCLYQPQQASKNSFSSFLPFFPAKFFSFSFFFFFFSFFYSGHFSLKEKKRGERFDWKLAAIYIDSFLFSGTTTGLDWERERKRKKETEREKETGKSEPLMPTEEKEEGEECYQECFSCNEEAYRRKNWSHVYTRHFLCPYTGWQVEIAPLF